MELLQNPIFTLCLIIMAGSLLGKVRIGSFAFGSSAIILVAMVFGHFGVVLPRIFLTLGLVLFIYTIGLQAGPAFFSSFRKRVLTASLSAFLLVFVGFLGVLAAAWIFGFQPGTAAGLFSGALTSSPGLAVAVALTGEQAAAAAYGVTYTFGVLGVILFMKLIAPVMRVNIPREERSIREEIEEQTPKVVHRHFEVTNPAIFEKRVSDLHLDEVAPVCLTRILKRSSSRADLVGEDTILEPGDRLRIVGTEKDLDIIGMMFGEPVDQDIQFSGELARKNLLVSKKEYAGRSIGSINFRQVFNVNISRITRHGMDLPAAAETRLQMGDILHVIGQQQAIDNVRRLVGNDVKAAYGADLIAIFVGILIGFLLGQVPLTLPWIGRFTLGYTGGVLVAGLVLGSLYKTGFFIWSLPEPANALIRELGLMIFLATVGTSAGSTILETIRLQGLTLVLCGAGITLLPLTLLFFVNHYLFKIRFLRNLGVLTGGMTSTPGLAAVESMSPTPYAPSAYASVYPFAMIAMILFTKLLISILS